MINSSARILQASRLSFTSLSKEIVTIRYLIDLILSALELHWLYLLSLPFPVEKADKENGCAFDNGAFTRLSVTTPPYRCDVVPLLGMALPVLVVDRVPPGVKRGRPLENTLEMSVLSIVRDVIYC